MNKAIIGISIPRYVENDTDDHGHEEYYTCDIHFSEGFGGNVGMDDSEDITVIYNAIKQTIK